MKKNSIIGFVLIGAILIGFSWYNSKIYREQEKEKMQMDSVARVQAKAAIEQMALDSASVILGASDSTHTSDSSRLNSVYKDSSLVKASVAQEEFLTLKMIKLRLSLQTRGHNLIRLK